MSNFVFDMLSTRRKKEISSLKQKKYRQKYSQFLVEGEKSVMELCHSAFDITEILMTQRRFEQVGNKFTNQNVLIINNKDMDQLSTQDTASGILAVSNYKDNTQFNPEFKNRFTIMLDGISDPGNLGTIIRTGDWFGIDLVICSPDCVDFYNPKTIASTMGSFTRVNVMYTPLESILKQANVPAFACVMNGDSINKLEAVNEGIIVIGNEANGISDSVIDLCKYKITIPKIGNAESLNAAIATAIICNKMVNG
jgi:TrmH family RNA methyltransferase